MNFPTDILNASADLYSSDSDDSLLGTFADNIGSNYYSDSDEEIEDIEIYDSDEEENLPVLQYEIPGPDRMSDLDTCSHTKYTGTDRSGKRQYHRCCQYGKRVEEKDFYPTNNCKLENYCATHDNMVKLPTAITTHNDYDIDYLWTNDLHLFASDGGDTYILADSQYNAKDRHFYHHPSCKCLSDCNPLNRGAPLASRNPGWTSSPKGVYQPHATFGCYIGCDLDNYQRAYNSGAWSEKTDAWWVVRDREGFFDTRTDTSACPMRHLDNEYLANWKRMNWIPANAPKPQQYIQEITVEV